MVVPHANDVVKITTPIPQSVFKALNEWVAIAMLSLMSRTSIRIRQ
jgi:hypothetical protein